jgi:hypothetical protein
MVDGFDIGGQASALCTQRFYDDCFSALTPTTASSPSTCMPATPCTVPTSVACVRASPTRSASWRPTDRVNEIVFAARGDRFRLSEKQLHLRACALERRLELPFGVAGACADRWPPPRVCANGARTTARHTRHALDD